jgi:uncharacterized repeat protein (TIGR02543 family)
MKNFFRGIRFLATLAISGLLLTGIIARGGSAEAAILYAKPTAAGDGSCDSWDNAGALHTALTNAADGDEIWVMAGTHKPDTTGLVNPREASFDLKNGVAIYGGFSGTETLRTQRDWETNITILSGDLNGDDSGFTNNTENTYHVVMGATGAVIDGVTISGGNANAGNPYDRGGGILNNIASPTLTNIIISGNAATIGAGIYNDAASPTLTNVTISGNAAGYSGGGMQNYTGSAPTLNNVIFNGNTGPWAGGMLNNASNPSLTNVTFYDNRATSQYGGGMRNENNSRPILTSVTFKNNRAANYGGGMNNDGSSPILTNVTFSGNAVNSSSNLGFGGGMANFGGAPELAHVTFSGNSANGIISIGGVNYPAGGGGGMYNSGSSARVKNCIFWGNSTPGNQNGPSIFNANNSGGVISDSVFYGGCPTNWTCTNLIGADPRLGALGNYGGSTETIPLLPGSSAIDAAITDCPAADQRGVARPQGTQCDIGAFESQGFTLTISGGNNQNAVINTAFAAPLGLTVAANAAIEPVAGGRITFTPPGSGASAGVTGSPATIGADGAASVTVTANGTPGGYNVTAGATGAADVNFALNNILTFTVAYNGNDQTSGAAPADDLSPYPDGSTVTILGEGSLIRTGYTFDGWNTADDGTGDSYAPGDTFTINANTTLYAQWAINTYTVTFNANGGAGAMSPQTGNYNTTAILNANSFTRGGYTFDGWNTAEDDLGVDYADGAEYTFIANITLYAQWKIDTYIVSGTAGEGGRIDPSSRTVEHGQTTTFTVTPDEGYGIETVTGCGGSLSGNTYTTGAITGACTVAASFSLNTYAVTYNANDADSGAVPAPQTKTHGIDLTLRENTGNLARTACTFAGWNTAANGAGTAYAEGAPYTTNATLTLYAMWICEFDFGDAPDPTYPTLLAGDGARHVIVPGYHLGAGIDSENDGQPDQNADGDEFDDGVIFGANLVQGVPAPVTITASAPGFINAWIDLNVDGDWDDAGEQIFADQAVAAGANLLHVAVPADAAPGKTFARFRFSSMLGLSFTGPADDGEVEDLVVVIYENDPAVYVYEDAEDGTTNRWDIYDDDPGASVFNIFNNRPPAVIRNIFDPEKNSRVIELDGDGSNIGYRLRNADGSFWGDSIRAVIQWSMNYAETFSVLVRINTTDGLRYLRYTPVPYNDLGIGQYIDFGLGKNAADGTWRTFTRDLAADLAKAQPLNTLISVDAFMIRGSGMIDDVVMMTSVPDQVYEDAENGTLDRWDIFDNDPAGAVIDNTFDAEKNSRVIELNGDGTKNGYRLRNADGSFWYESTRAVIQWSMNYSGTFVVQVRINTTDGPRYLRYKPVQSSALGTGKTIDYGLGKTAADGTWRIFTRNLAADLAKAQPGNTLTSVDAFMIRGSGMIDDVVMMASVPDCVYEDAEDAAIDRWDIFDNDPAGAVIRNIFDPGKNSRVIELDGDGGANGYRLQNADGSFWNESTRAVIQWRMNYSDTFTVLLRINTTDGLRYLRYKPLQRSDLGTDRYIDYGLGKTAADGTWRTFTRNLAADLSTAQPGNTLISLDAFMIKGSGMIDDVVMME